MANEIATAKATDARPMTPSSRRGTSRKDNVWGDDEELVRLTPEKRESEPIKKKTKKNWRHL